MYQALYRKYRPSTFSDVCGQEHITSVLKTQLQKGRVSHAYIFCGSRGTGKTTCAKILAKAVNCQHPVDGEPCNECEVCRGIDEERIMDVVEMDAASNNGVDHIRRLCDEVQFMPSQATKRVYIIDEVHMLSASAFNALLKTIEEPPSHVLFILATTETNDIPATIMSRCQRFDFKRITPEIISSRLLEIAEKEKIPLKKDAAFLIARLSDGAMRDALSLLEACRGYQGDITAEQVHSILGIGSREDVISLCRSVTEQDVSSCLEIVGKLYESMSDFKVLIGEMLSIYRDLLVMRSVPNYAAFVVSYGEELSQIEKIAKSVSVETLLYQIRELEDFYVSYDRIATEKKAASEILMIRLCSESLVQTQEALLSRIARLEKALAKGSIPSAEKEPSPKEPLSKRQTKPSPEPEGSLPAKEEGLFEGSVKLKHRLQKESFILPWLEMISFRKEKNVLHLISSAFIQGMLGSAGAREVLLSCAKEVDSEIDTLIFDTEKEEKKDKFPSEFEGL